MRSPPFQYLEFVNDDAWYMRGVVELPARRFELLDLSTPRPLSDIGPDIWDPGREYFWRVIDFRANKLLYIGHNF